MDVVLHGPSIPVLPPVPVYEPASAPALVEGLRPEKLNLEN